jgi:hypothetical protein
MSSCDDTDTDLFLHIIATQRDVMHKNYVTDFIIKFLIDL